MNWLVSLDVDCFRLINQSLSHPVLDWLMPRFSSNPLFAPALVVLAVLLLWRGATRGRVCAAMLLLVVGGLNNLAVDSLKHAYARPRPFLTLPEARLLMGRGGSYSLPSSHAANWFAGAVVACIYYRRSRWFMFPAATLVSLSRVYVGVHYPSDVLAGAAVGSVVGGGGVWLANRLWRGLGRRWFPLWWRRMPSLAAPVCHPDPLAWQPDQAVVRNPELAAQQQWLRLGYVLIAALLVARLAYLVGGHIELSEDEAYQWLWSKHLALSYYSKPPLIAYTQFLGTALWGDNEFGVRFFSPVIAAVVGWLVLRFFAREVNTRAAFWLVPVLAAVPLLAAGSVLMTIDPLSVLFWTAAMIAGWRACQSESRVRDWLWVGWWMGLGFLSKYTGLLQWVSLVVFSCLWSTARRQWRRPGPYLALLVNAACALPVLLWNAQHDWITLTHLHDRAGLSEPWRPTARFLLDFTASEAALLNPVFFGGMLWAAVAVWRKRRHNPFLMYLWSMGAPLFIIFWLYTLRARVQPNWIAPAVLPLFCVMVAYADSRWRAGVQQIQRWLVAGLALGLPVVVLAHDTNLVGKIIGRPLPPKFDPLRRVRAWREMAQVVGDARRALLAEGKPAFVIGDHYGISGLLSFYLPEAKAGVPAHPLVYCLSSDKPANQFGLWPGYAGRKGQNAIYVQHLYVPQPPPEQLVREFGSVSDLGVKEVVYRGRVLRRIQLFACRDLR